MPNQALGATRLRRARQREALSMMTVMSNKPIDPALKSYLDVAYSFTQGLLRIWGAEAAFARLMCALTEFRSSGRAGLDGPASAVLQHLDRIPYSSYDALAYVTNVSHLVYATTLLDTFLSDTTLFLFLLIPHSMGKNQQVPLSTVIQAASKNEALTQAALARSREIGYLPFSGRLQFLRETFGLSLDIDAEAAQALDHYPSVRNTAVHDQGVFKLLLDDNGIVTSKQKTCPLHPTKVTGDDVHKAIHAYETVVRTVAASVFKQVLKQADHPAVQQYLHGAGLDPGVSDERRKSGGGA